MANGIRTTNLERQFAIDELLGNVTEDGVEKTARIPIAALAAQLAGSGPFVFGNTVYVLTKAALDAYTPILPLAGGVVLNDPDPANNGYYARQSGAWVKGRGFPDTFARVALSGSGTVQTGVVKTGVNPADIEVFFATVITDNSGPLTLSVNGGPARQVVNLAGNALSAGEWTGVVMFFLNSDGQYQLMLDAGAAAAAAQSATDAAASEAAALASEQSAAASAAAAGVASGRLEIAAFAELATKFVYSAPGPGQQLVAAGDVITWREKALAWKVVLTGSGDPDIDYTGAGGVKLYVLPTNGKLYADAFGLVPNSEAAAATNKAIWATIRAAAVSARGSKEVETGPATYWFPLETRLSAPKMRLRGIVSVFKIAATTEDGNGFLITESDGFRYSGIEFDGNRVNVPNVGPDRCLVLVFNVEDAVAEDIHVHSTKGKGAGFASGVAGKGVINCHIRNSRGGNCGTQVFIMDRSNGLSGGGADAIPCRDSTFEHLKVYATDHGGVAINDGTLRCKALFCDADVQNAVWDAISVRGSRDTLIQGCIGRRGRNGFQAYVLDAAAIARGEVCDGLTLVGNLWEENQQSGCSLGGALNWSMTGDTAKNNGKGGGLAFGIIVIQRSGVRRAADGSINGCIAIDDQPTTAVVVTISQASPAVVTMPAHGLVANNIVTFTTTGALPTGLTVGVPYFVKTVLDANTFTVCLTQGGAAINTSSAGAGDHTLTHGKTQHTAFGVLASDRIKISNPIMRGNPRSRVFYDGSVTGLEVTGDGADGATKKRASATTGSIAASGTAVVTVPFVTPFDVTPNHAQASILVATSGAAIVVEQITAITAAAVQVRVRNTTAGALTGTVFVTAEYLS